MNRMIDFTTDERIAFDKAIVTHCLDTIRDNMGRYVDDSGDYIVSANDVLHNHIRIMSSHEMNPTQNAYEPLIGLAVARYASDGVPAVYYDYASEHMGYDDDLYEFKADSIYASDAYLDTIENAL